MCLALTWVSEREHVPNSVGCSEDKLLVSSSDTAETAITETKQVIKSDFEHQHDPFLKR